MDFGELPEPESNAKPGTRSLPFEIDLNETPLPSPRETLAADEGASSAAAAGARGNESERLRRAVRLFDINASPPREADGEGFVEQSYGDGGLVTIAEHNADKMRIVRDIPFGRSLNAPETSSNMFYMENGFSLLKASRDWTPSQPSFEDIVKQRLHKTLKGVDFSSPLNGGIWPSHGTPLNFNVQHQGEVYLRALKDYIHTKQGRLGDGWLVEFVYCKIRCKTFPVYRAPDGNRFESMVDVAGHLGLLTNYRSLEIEDRSDGLASLQKKMHLDGRRKEFLRSSRANFRQNHNILVSSSAAGISSGSKIMGHEFESYRKSTVETDFKEHARRGFELSQDVCPLQFEDLVVLSLGKVDPRPTYHSTSQIWPVGFRSCWHDKITGSLFVFEIVDGGDAGPIFKVKRYPCYTQPIPIGTTVLLRQKSDSKDGRDKEPNDDSATSGMDDEESMSIKMMLTEDCPPLMEDVICRKVNSSTTESSCFPQSDVNIIPDDAGWVDGIGEFSVEGRSCSMVWDRASQTLLRAFHDVYKNVGILKNFCKHNVNEVEVKAAENYDSLSKFCYLSGLGAIPPLVQSKSDFDFCSDMIVKWLQQDRFGLDTEFVQEILEQLPGIHGCLDYKFLSERGQNSGSQTVRSGFLLVKRKRDVQGGKGGDGFISSCNRPRKPFVEESDLKKSFPLGKQLSSKLLANLIGDVVQAWEFLWRFSKVLGLEKNFSFQELENELVNPWLDNINPLEGSGNETQNCGNFTLCTGAALKKAHSSLLKVVVREVLLKVSGYVDPSSDAVEGKSRRGRKKDADNSFASRKMKLDMLPINELTWPELARRYILVFLSLEGNLDSGEHTCRESSKIFHCLRGDGGTLCGSLTGVAGMEADARFLAEASMKVFGLVKKNDFVSMGQDKPDTVSTPKMITESVNEVPEWVLALEPARKLPTNVGARIRKCVFEALSKNPPEWAKQILQHSISKEVYKGNASGPTKRAIVSLLADVSHKDLQPKPDKKEKVKTVSTLSDLIMKQCRIVLRRIVVEDEEKVFCNLLGRTLLNHNDNDDEGLLGYPAMVSRPLDFRTIDFRLAGGAYGGSHEAFLDDVREVWNILRTAYADQSDVVDLVESLSQKFDIMYDKEVLSVAKKFTENANSPSISDEGQKEIDELLVHANESSIPKAPWDEGVCKVCGIDKDDDNVLLCDTCDSEYHTYCLSPPLARIPDGNWYCPSCVAGQSKSKGLSHGTQVKWRRKKRYQGDLTRNLMETLSRLARTMGSKEYWDFSVQERTFLIKFFCDETLNTSVIRDHLDHCATTSADFQQKLRSLSAEWKNLKMREEILAANMEKANAVDNRAGVSTPDGLAYVVNKDGKSLGNMPNKGDNVSFPQLEDGPHCNGTNVNGDQPFLSLSKSNSEQHHTSSGIEISGNRSLVTPCQVPQGLISSDGIRTNVAESVAFVAVNSESMLNGHHSSLQSAESAFQDSSQEMSSLKHEISVVRDSITQLEYELQRVSIRKGCLGRDSNGRIYWGFEKADSSALMVVNGSIIENSSNSGGPKVSWLSYQSDPEIEEIIGWLRDGNARERELKESILHWQRKKPKDSKNSENPVQNEKRPSFLVTKAVTALEKKYGPGLGSQAADMSEKRGHKCNLYRCECLEPIWSSKHHCLSCHQTYSSSEELERHSDVKCSGGSVITKTKKVNEDSSKGKKVAAETPVKKRPRINGKGKPSRGEKKEIGLNVTKVQDSGFPYDFEEIRSKFVPQNSLKDLVKDVGLIGSSGTPTFVPSASPCVNDPALRLVPAKTNEAGGGHESIQGTNIEGEMECCFENFPSYVGSEIDEASKVETLVGTSASEGYQMSGNKRKSGCTIPESSLRRLVGRVTHILRQLKINLLDMDAALPDEALRPSMAHLEKRSAWRAFVKSAGSIYEVVQATVLLENMIKADYLRKDWWYWSSLSSASTISTLSALALRVYTLDTVIIFEKPSSPTSDSTEIPKPGDPDGEGTSPKLDTPNNTAQKTSTDQTENSKPKSRLNKRKKDSGS